MTQGDGVADKQVMRLDEVEREVVRLWRSMNKGRLTIAIENHRPTGDVTEHKETYKLLKK